LCNALQCCSENTDADAGQFHTTVTLEIDLTELGFNNLEKVLLAVYQYTAMLQRTDMKVMEKLYKEYQLLKQLDFDNRKETNTLTNTEEIASSMVLYPPEHYLTGGELMFEYNEKQIKDVINHLVYTNSLITIRSQKMDFTNIDVKVEEHFQTEYAITDLCNNWKNLFDTANQEPFNEELFINNPNQFIPKYTSLLTPPPAGTECKVPKVLTAENSPSRLYFKPDYKFGRPKVIAMVEIKMELLDYRQEISFSNTIRLICKLFNHQFACINYPATEAGLNLDFNYRQPGNLVLEMSGYQSQMKVCIF